MQTDALDPVAAARGVLEHLLASPSLDDWTLLEMAAAYGTLEDPQRLSDVVPYNGPTRSASDLIALTTSLLRRGMVRVEPGTRVFDLADAVRHLDAAAREFAGEPNGSSR